MLGYDIDLFCITQNDFMPYRLFDRGESEFEVLRHPCINWSKREAVFEIILAATYYMTFWTKIEIK